MNKLSSQLYIFKSMAGSLFGSLRRQRMSSALLLAFVLLFLAVVFAFLAFAPVLSPFIYPLF